MPAAAAVKGQLARMFCFMCAKEKTDVQTAVPNVNARGTFYVKN